MKKLKNRKFDFGSPFGGFNQSCANEFEITLKLIHKISEVNLCAFKYKICVKFGTKNKLMNRPKQSPN